MCTTSREALLPKRNTQWRYACQGASLREAYSTPTASSYVATRQETNVTPAGHQKSTRQPDVTST